MEWSDPLLDLLMSIQDNDLSVKSWKFLKQMKSWASMGIQPTEKQIQYLRHLQTAQLRKKRKELQYAEKEYIWAKIGTVAKVCIKGQKEIIPVLEYIRKSDVEKLITDWRNAYPDLSKNVSIEIEELDLEDCIGIFVRVEANSMSMVNN